MSEIDKDPEAAFFKKLEGLQPCELMEIKAGTHTFAVYGDNFFKTASYTIEALCAATYESCTHKLKDVEQQILTKRRELRQFESDYRKALAQFQEVTNRYTLEKQNVEELLKKRDNIQSAFTVKMSNGGNNSRDLSEEEEEEDGTDKSTAKKRWFNLSLRLSAHRKSN